MGFSLIVNSTIGGDTSGLSSVDGNLQTAILGAINAAVAQTLTNHNVISSPSAINFTPVNSPANPIKST